MNDIKTRNRWYFGVAIVYSVMLVFTLGFNLLQVVSLGVSYGIGFNGIAPYAINTLIASFFLLVVYGIIILACFLRNDIFILISFIIAFIHAIVTGIIGVTKFLSYPVPLTNLTVIFPFVYMGVYILMIAFQIGKMAGLRKKGMIVALILSALNAVGALVFTFINGIMLLVNVFNNEMLSLLFFIALLAVALNLIRFFGLALPPFFIPLSFKKMDSE